MKRFVQFRACCCVMAFLSLCMTGSAYVWALEEYDDRVKDQNGVDIPTNAIIQIAEYSGGGDEFVPPVDFGSATGYTTNWHQFDTGKVPRPGMIIGIYSNRTWNTFREVIRIIIPPGDYEGDGCTLPNPVSTGGLWVGHLTQRYSVNDGTGLAFYNVNAPSVWNFYPIGPDQDSDGDLLSDAWEWAYFNNPTSAVTGIDTDLDGFTNGDEAIAKTNPVDSNSYLRVSALPSGTPGQGISIAWFAYSNVHYGVECFTNLVSGQSALIISNIVMGTSAIYSTNDLSADQGAFYRLIVFPPSP